MSIPESAVREGLASAVWHARFEKVGSNPLVIFDGAHNPQGIEQAVRSIRHYFGDRKVYLLTGVLRDKDYTEIAAMLSTVASRAFTLTPDSPRALSAEEYASVLLQSGVHATAYGSIDSAFYAARAAAAQDGVPLLCLGSLYVYASLCPLFGKN
jgi:dihydrofolate synthase/folylpolyglutamate synthase